jgi:peptidyl-prolyl cis-trans isomerase SurA
MRKFFSLLLAALTISAAVTVHAQTAPAASASGQGSKPAAKSSSKPEAAIDDEAVVEEIVARINNAIVTRGDIRREHEKMAQDIKQQNLADPAAALADGEKNLLRSLIDQQLLLQKGDELGISVDADLIKRLDQMRRDMGAASMEEMEKAATAQGVNFEDFKQGIKNDLITQRVIGQEVGSHVQITRDEVQKYYDAHKAEMDQPEQVNLSEILIPVGTGDSSTEPSEADLAQAKANADSLEAKLKAGSKFEDLARNFSKGPSAAQGGELGYFKRGALAKALEDKTFALKTGDVTEPLRTRQGFVILKVNDHTTPGIPPLSKIEDQIKNNIYYEKVQPAVREYLTKLREDAYIDIHAGYVDTGASTKQTTLVMTNTEVKNGKGKANTVKTITDHKKKHHFLF